MDKIKIGLVQFVSFQTQINNKLRRVMEADDSNNDLCQTARELLKDDNFIVALKDRLKAA
jgi:hypothetical protein